MTTPRPIIMRVEVTMVVAVRLIAKTNIKRAAKLLNVKRRLYCIFRASLPTAASSVHVFENDRQNLQLNAFTDSSGLVRSLVVPRSFYFSSSSFLCSLCIYFQFIFFLSFFFIHSLYSMLFLKFCSNLQKLCVRQVETQ